MPTPDHGVVEFSGPSGTLRVHGDDEVARKLMMLIEGTCQGCGVKAAAAKYGYTPGRYHQLFKAYEQGGSEALRNEKRGPKTRSRRTEEVVRQIVRHRFLDPDASAAVIAQKLVQSGHPISGRSVQRTLAEFGLQKGGSTGTTPTSRHSR